MVDLGQRILISALIIAIIVPCAFANGSQKIVPCEEAAKNATKVKVGMKESEVLDLLGSPKTITDSRWSYSFECVKRHLKVGETVITGLDIFFSDGTVKKIKLVWVEWMRQGYKDQLNEGIKGSQHHNQEHVLIMASLTTHSTRPAIAWLS